MHSSFLTMTKSFVAATLLLFLFAVAPAAGGEAALRRENNNGSFVEDDVPTEQFHRGLAQQCWGDTVVECKGKSSFLDCFLCGALGVPSCFPGDFSDEAIEGLKNALKNACKNIDTGNPCEEP